MKFPKGCWSSRSLIYLQCLHVYMQDLDTNVPVTIILSFFLLFFFLGPPHLNPALKNLSVPLNSTFETYCFKRGDPPVSVNWTKDGKALGNNNTLVIKRVTFDDGGFYECAAENQVGKVNISFWIDVTGKSKPLFEDLQTVLG